jgi:riboflavin synthase alpha subunit
MEHTNLHAKKVGDLVNLEYDLIAKYVEKLGGMPA